MRDDRESSAGAPPVRSCEVKVGGIRRSGEAVQRPDGGAKAGQRVFAALSEGKEPAEEDTALFSEWKRAYISRLCRIFTELLS